MAEEDYNKFQTTSDDMSVLTALLHQIHGLKPVSTGELALEPIEAEEGDSALTYNE